MKYIKLEIPHNTAPMIEYQTELQATCKLTDPNQHDPAISALLLVSFVCMHPAAKESKDADWSLVPDWAEFDQALHMITDEPTTLEELALTIFNYVCSVIDEARIGVFSLTGKSANHGQIEIIF